MAESAGAPAHKVFISYASASRDRVGVLAGALEKEGFEVWWDHALNPGEDYRQKIEAALANCDVAVVCWTPPAAQSDWVISEADDARQRGRLVPILIEACRIPKPFDRLHTADLTAWRGQRSAPAFQKLAEAVKAMAEGRAPKRKAWRRRLFTVGGLTAAAGAAATAFLNYSAIDGFVENKLHPTATRQDVAGLDAKVDAVLVMLKAKADTPIDAQSEAALRDSIASLLSAQDSARARAAAKLTAGDRDGALSDLRVIAASAEKGAASIAETYKEIGALAFPDRTADSIAAYERAMALAPDDAAARNQLGWLYVRSGRLAEAEAAYQRILDTTGKADVRWQATALGNLGNVATTRGDLVAAEGFYGRALVLDESLNRLDGQAADLGNLGNLAQARGDLAAAEDFGKRALAIDEKLGSREGQAFDLVNLGMVARLRGELVAAEGFHKRALVINESLGSLEGQAADLFNLGLVAFTRGDLASAEDFFKRALPIEEKIAHLDGQANALGGLGLVAQARNDLGAAEDFQKRALAISEKLGSLQGQAIALDHLGVVKTMQGDLVAAKGLIERALAMDEKSGGLEGQANDLDDLGVVARLSGMLDEAETALKKSLVFAERLGSPELQANALAHLGSVALDRKDMKSAEAHWRQALATYRKIGMKLDEQRVEDLLRSTGANPDASAKP